MMTKPISLLLACVALTAATGCERSPSDPTPGAANEQPKADAAAGAGATRDVNEDKPIPAAHARASASMAGASGSDVTGTVDFRELDDGVVQISIALENLKPNITHGLHIHETGDCSAKDASSAGGHFNPTEDPHGLPPTSPRHAGDLGNVKSDDGGKVLTTKELGSFQIRGANSVVGRSVILHANPDTGGQPSGDAGPRIACGVIES